jgi:hypothetical protein
MFKSIQEYLLSHTASDERGASIYEHEISRALNHALDYRCIDRFIEDNYELSSCNRVLYSSQLNWIDIMVSLIHASKEKKNIIITYESDTNKFIASTEIYHTPRTLDGNTAKLPFALATRSFSDTVRATNDQMQELNSRRQLFMKGIVAALLPVMGVISPAMASTTPYTTTSDTKTPKSQQTSTGTSGVTTPGDNDTKPDTKIDHVTDTTRDSHQDTRDDK